MARKSTRSTHATRSQNQLRSRTAGFWQPAIPQRSLGTRKVDLKGAAVVPGFVDAHPHMDGAGWDLIRPGWGRIESIDDVLDQVKRQVAKLAPGEWLVMPCLAELPDYYRLPETLREKRWPNRHDLDKVSPDNPVYIEPHFLAIPGVA